MNSDTASRAARAALTKNAKLRHTFHTPRRGREIIDSWQYGPAATGPPVAAGRGNYIRSGEKVLLPLGTTAGHRFHRRIRELLI